MSNLYIAIEALRLTSYDPNDPVWQKALIFASRMQNRSESNDQKWARNDGGFAYSPGMNPPEMGGGTNSYASVTAAGLYGLLLIGVEKSDPRVQAAYKWLTANYTLDSNFGTNSKKRCSISTARSRRSWPRTAKRSSSTAGASGTTGATIWPPS